MMASRSRSSDRHTLRDDTGAAPIRILETRRQACRAWLLAARQDGAARPGTRSPSPRRLAQTPPARARISSGWRGQRLILLHDVRDDEPRLRLEGLAAGVWCVRGDLEGIARLDAEGRAPLDGDLECTFQDPGRLDARVGMAPDRHASLDGCFGEDGHVAGHRAVYLRQDLSRNTRRSGGWCGIFQ